MDTIKNINISGIFIFVFTGLFTYLFISFIFWLFSGPSNTPQSAVGEQKSTNIKKNSLKGFKTYSNPEVFNIKENAHRFAEAEDICKRYNARLADKSELLQAQKDGANWCNLGWLTSQDAYYPTQQEQIDIANKWPVEFRGGCGKVGVNGGFYPAQLKLSVNCYGIKPTDSMNINPWNTINNKWSKYS